MGTKSAAAISLLDAGRPVASFPITEPWHDIGQLADYERVAALDHDARAASGPR